MATGNRGNDRAQRAPVNEQLFTHTPQQPTNNPSRTAACCSRPTRVCHGQPTAQLSPQRVA
eukprot:4777124-Lingulodinium_polyedra.AAC.1